jgi:hypothetical protein
MTELNRTEMLELLEALCEDRMTDAQRARLERLALVDRDALRLYLNNVDLHGMLYWDAAVAAGVGALAEVATRLDGAPTVRREAVPARRGTWRGAAALASCAALLLIAVWLSRPGPGTPGGNPDRNLTGGPTDPPSGGNPSTIGPPIRIDSPGRPGESTPRDLVDGTAREKPGTGHPTVVDDGTDPSLSSLGIVSYINTEVQRAWHQAEIEPSPRADDAEWVRRVYLDLVGHIPAPDAVEAFLQDSTDDKRTRLVDELLARPEYARHFATVWTNLLIGRNPAPEVDRNGLAKFLRDAFRANRRWSETVDELIAAEGSGSENGAANFLIAHLNNEAVPATAVTARVFLGTQVQCTQCHDHPTNKTWDQDQFWKLNSFFQQTAVIERRASDPATGRMTVTGLELVSKPEGGPTHYETRSGVMKAVFPQYGETEIDPGPGTNRRRELARLLTAGDEPQLAAAFVNRAWAHCFGHGFTTPVDDMGPHNQPTHPELLQRLADEFVKSGYDVKQLLRWICNSEPYQLTSRFSAHNAIDEPGEGQPPLFSRMYVKALSPEQVFDSLLVATKVDQSAAYFTSEADTRRAEWLRQFFTAQQTEENSEATTFDGSLPQALVMMNGDLVQQATSGAPGTYLSNVLTGAGNEADKIRRLSLATLSRPPTPRELEAVRSAWQQNVRWQTTRLNVPARAASNEALRDVFWAYLNSSEFIVNH